MSWLCIEAPNVASRELSAYRRALLRGRVTDVLSLADRFDDEALETAHREAIVNVPCNELPLHVHAAFRAVSKPCNNSCVHHALLVSTGIPRNSVKDIAVFSTLEGIALSMSRQSSGCITISRV